MSFAKTVSLVSLVFLFALPAEADTDFVETRNVSSRLRVRAEANTNGEIIGWLYPGDSARLIDSETSSSFHQVSFKDQLAFVAKGHSQIVSVSAALKIAFLDVNQGDSALLQSGDTDILIDGGPTGSWGRSLKDAITSATGEVEVVFISHPHDDHFVGASKLLSEDDQPTVGRIITNGEKRGPPRDAAPLSRWKTFEDAASAADLELENLEVGDLLNFGPTFNMTVMATGSPDGGEFPDTNSGKNINNDSLVLLISYAGRRVLFTGDIQNDAQIRLIGHFCDDSNKDTCPALNSDVLKVPHHGSRHSEFDFFDAVAPSNAVISAEFDNDHGSPPRGPMGLDITPILGPWPIPSS